MTRNQKLLGLLIMAVISLAGCGGRTHMNPPPPPSPTPSATSLSHARFSAIPSNGTKMVIK